MIRILCRSSLVLLCLTIVSICNGNPIVNSSFETFESMGMLPTDYGYWGGDLAEIVGSKDGITPFEGSNILQFNTSYPTGPSINYTGCDIWQIVDISHFASEIRNGGVSVSFSCMFNRVAFDIETDSMFLIRVGAYAGTPDTFPQQRETSELGLVTEFLYSDGDIGTWESLNAGLLLPSDTDFIAIEIAASENVFNDGSGIEFDGHYADAATLSIVPEPATILLLGLGGMLLRTKRQ